MKLASCKSALNPPVVYSTDRSKAVVPVLVLLLVALWFILRGNFFFYVLSCVILFLCFSVLLALRLPRLGKRELILVFLYVCSSFACLDLSVSSSSWCLGMSTVCDCGSAWTFLLPFFHCRILLVKGHLFSQRDFTRMGLDFFFFYLFFIFPRNRVSSLMVSKTGLSPKKLSY